MDARNGDYALNRYVYIICRVVNGQITQPVKIGISNNPIVRLRELQTGSPHKLIILRSLLCRNWPDAADIERKMHAELSRFCEDGEWFNVDPILAVIIAAALTHEMGGETDRHLASLFGRILPMDLSE